MFKIDTKFPHEARGKGDYLAPGVALEPGERVVVTDKYVCDPGRVGAGEAFRPSAPRLLVFSERTVRSMADTIGMVTPEAAGEYTQDAEAAFWEVAGELDQVRAELAAAVQDRDVALAAVDLMRRLDADAAEPAEKPAPRKRAAKKAPAKDERTDTSDAEPAEA